MSTEESPRYRVLFVDDEPSVLAGLRNLLRKKRRIWDMHFAEGGAAALDMMDEQAFDVVVTDMRMPGMDGAALLAEVRARHPATARIILSGHTEESAIFRAVPVAHRFLSKPCDPDLLQSTVERVLEVRRRLGDERVRALLGSVQNLPSLPQVFHQLNQVLADENASAAKVAEVVEQDMGITAKLLQLVNSAFFGLPQKIASVERAVSYLGMNTIKGLVTSAAIYDALNGRQAPGFDPRQFQSHSLLVSRLAVKLAGSQDEQIMLSGLLHDIGKLVMIRQAGELFAKVHEVCRQQEVARHEAEYRLAGCSHAELGGALLDLWGIPEAVVEAVSCHHRPSPDWRGLEAPVAVYLGNELARGRQPDEQLLEAWGLRDDWPGLRQRVTELLEQA